jgi:hypothetical protein
MDEVFDVMEANAALVIDTTVNIAKMDFNLGVGMDEGFRKFINEIETAIGRQYSPRVRHLYEQNYKMGYVQARDMVFSK